MKLRVMLVGIACAALVGCASPSTPSRAPADEPIQLRFMAPDAPCLLTAVALPLTLKIDAGADEPVVAVGPDGTRHHVWWSPGFRGGTASDPVVRDPDGQVVARDGEVIDASDQGWPSLHGYRVCAGSESIWVFLAGPA